MAAKRSLNLLGREMQPIEIPQIVRETKIGTCTGQRTKGSKLNDSLVF